MIEPCDKCVQDKECDGGPFCGCACHDGILRRKSMIPEHLQGKSAAQILDKIRENFERQKTVTYLTDYNYAKLLEEFLLLAIKDALCNTDGKTLCDGDYGLMGSEAECRAIAFLNTVLPKE